MLEEPPDLRADAVLRLVQAHWDPGARSARHAAVGAGAHHWTICDDVGPRWFATADHSRGPGTRRYLSQAYGTAATLAAAGEKYAAAPVPTTAGEQIIPAGSGRFLSLATYIHGTSGDGEYSSDAERVEIARVLGRLHSVPAPPDCNVWSPSVPGLDMLTQLLDTLGSPWETGPYGEPTRNALAESETRIRSRIRRFHALSDMLSATSSPLRQGWVLTHGEPHTANVLWSESGPFLLDWESAALAPRERDLRVVLGGAQSNAPGQAYHDASGVSPSLRSDIVALFDCEWTLREISEYAVRFNSPHTGDADDARCFADLCDELAAIA